MGVFNVLANLFKKEKWETIKISDNLFIEKIPESVKEKWRRERRNKDNLNSFISENGFHFKPDGRSATIYYIENRKVCELDCEMAVGPDVNIIIYRKSMENWALPKKEKLSLDEKTIFEKSLEIWLKEQKLRPDFG